MLKIDHGPVTIMKIFGFIIAVAVMLGLLGCSTAAPKNTVVHHTDVAAAAMLVEARQLYELGKMNAAEQKLLSVLDIEPNNRIADYYLTLIKELRERAASQRRQTRWGYYYPTYPLKPVYQ